MRRLVLPIAAAATAIVILLGGCGAADESGSVLDAAHQVPPTSHAPVRVGLTEWTIVVSRTRVPAGALHLVVTNTGATVHDLVVRDRLGTWETPDLHPGQQTRLVVRAGPHGTLQLWCSMPGHRAQGMYTTLRTS